jgi:hypothetical protein
VIGPFVLTCSAFSVLFAAQPEKARRDKVQAELEPDNWRS